MTPPRTTRVTIKLKPRARRHKSVPYYRKSPKGRESVCHCLEEMARLVRGQSKGALKGHRSTEAVSDCALGLPQNTSPHSKGGVFLFRILTIREIGSDSAESTEKAQTLCHRKVMFSVRVMKRWVQLWVQVKNIWGTGNVC